jgi:sugar-specific transcriptional regulator TrmB
MPEFTLNQLKIYRALRVNGMMVRKDIVILLNIPRSTVINALMLLERKGFLKHTPIHNNRRGRPYVGWEVVRG